MKYNKLVRDRIPEIIRSRGQEPVTHIALDSEYQEKLGAKLREEVAEYLHEPTDEELGDVLEVLLAIAELRGLSRERLEELREQKAQERGRFQKRIILDEVKEVQKL